MRNKSCQRRQAPAELTLKTKLVCLYANISPRYSPVSALRARWARGLACGVRKQREGGQLSRESKRVGAAKEAMILTKCAQCAAPLEHNAPRCGVCKLRYCGRECQKRHWKVHKPFCPEIKRGGGAEQYNADKKYKEFVAVAVEKCAADTKGQTCYICTEAVHWKTKEGLVRGCACRGTSGCAHVSCLEEQAKILVAEAEDNHLGNDAFDKRWDRWHHCGLCEQRYHGVVACALSWACWKTYVGRPEADDTRTMAMGQLGNGLSSAELFADAMHVRETELAMLERQGKDNTPCFLNTQCNLANTYQKLGRYAECLKMQRLNFALSLRVYGREEEETLAAVINLVAVLLDWDGSGPGRFDEVKSLLSQSLPVARRVLGESHRITLISRLSYEEARYLDPSATLNDHRGAVVALEEVARDARRVLGAAHPHVEQMERSLNSARRALHVREALHARRGAPQGS